MRLFVSGSAPLLTETHLEWERATGHRILER
jgi:malonyl-CoA/methylmalonyl-CoA synthetase